MARERSNGWQGDFTFKGKRIRRDGFATKAEAEGWEVEEKALLLRGQRPTPANATPTTQADRQVDNYTLDMLVDYTFTLKWTGKKNGEESRRLAREVAKLLAAIVTGKADATAKDARPGQLTNSHIDDLVARLTGKGNSPGTINRKLTALMMLMNVAERRNVGPTPPLKIEWQSEKGRQRERYFSREEEEKIIGWFEKDEKRNMADLVTFLLDSGCRLSEALQMTWRDIPTLGDGEPIRVWSTRTAERAGTKNGKSRTTYQTIRVAAMLERRKAACPIGQARVFHDVRDIHYAENWWTRMRTGIGAQGEKDFCLHSCRHTWASRLANSGVHQLVLMQIGGWSSLKLVERYAHIDTQRHRSVLNVLNAYKD